MEDEVVDRRTASDGLLARRVTQASEGERRSAEAELCRRFIPRIRAYGWKHLGSEARADDLVQRVMTTVIEKLRSGNVRDPDSIGSFVLGVARLQAKESFREGSKMTELEDVDSIPAGLENEQPDVLALSRLPQCLSCLSERERAVVLMSYYEGREAEYISKLWRTTPSNVRVIRHRALMRLRRCVRGQEGEA